MSQARERDWGLGKYFIVHIQQLITSQYLEGLPAAVTWKHGARATARPRPRAYMSSLVPIMRTLDPQNTPLPPPASAPASRWCRPGPDARRNLSPTYMYVYITYVCMYLCINTRLTNETINLLHSYIHHLYICGTPALKGSFGGSRKGWSRCAN